MITNENSCAKMYDRVIERRSYNMTNPTFCYHKHMNVMHWVDRDISQYTIKHLTRSPMWNLEKHVTIRDSVILLSQHTLHIVWLWPNKAHRLYIVNMYANLFQYISIYIYEANTSQYHIISASHINMLNISVYLKTMQRFKRKGVNTK